jgi:protein TonB
MLAVLFVAMTVQAASQAPTPTVPAIVIHHADWEKMPNGRALRAVYPKAARKSRIDGRVTMLCGVLATGRLTKCSTVEETPSGWGFGDAALGLASAFRMKPVTPSGQSVAGGTITIPMVFKAP